MMDTLLVFCTFPDPTKAREVARVLVAEQLAACVNLLPAVTSIYVWQGKHEETEETLALLKTRRDRYPALEARLRGLHPYEVPEIIAVELTVGLPEYLQWVADQTMAERMKDKAKRAAGATSGQRLVQTRRQCFRNRLHNDVIFCIIEMIIPLLAK